MSENLLTGNSELTEVSSKRVNFLYDNPIILVDTYFRYLVKSFEHIYTTYQLIDSLRKFYHTQSHERGVKLEIKNC